LVNFVYCVSSVANSLYYSLVRNVEVGKECGHGVGYECITAGLFTLLQLSFFYLCRDIMTTTMEYRK